MESNNNHQNDEITLKELILKLKEFKDELLRYWWIIGICSAIGVGGFLYVHFNSELEYKAEMKFIVEGDSSGSGMLGGLLGQIGIRKNSKNNPYKILEISRSNRLTESLLNEKVHNNLLANGVIEVYNEQWVESYPSLEAFRFSDKINLDKDQERIAFRSLKLILWGTNSNRSNALITIKHNEDTGIYTISVKTKDEQLSIDLAEVIYGKIKSFFEDEVFSNKQKTIEILQSKVDSINILKQAKVYELAKFEDSNRNAVYNTMNAKKTILRNDIQTLMVVYGEILKNLELADVNLKDSKPMFMIVETPLSPIVPIRSSLLLSILKGLLLGGFISGLYIIFRKIFREVMA